MRMNFVQDATARIEGLLAVNRDFCRRQIVRNSPQMPPTNCAGLPKKMSQSAAAPYFFTRYVKQAGVPPQVSAVPWHAAWARGHDIRPLDGNSIL